MKKFDLSSSEPRMASPVLLRLSETDRNRLKALSKKTGLPMATIAYRALKQVLEQESDKAGAQ